MHLKPDSMREDVLRCHMSKFRWLYSALPLDATERSGLQGYRENSDDQLVRIDKLLLSFIKSVERVKIFNNQSLASLVG